MGFSQSYPPFPDKKEAIDMIRQAVELDVSFFDTAGAYNAHRDFIVPIPGTKKVSRIKENLGALQVAFTDVELKEIREKLDSITILGDRYPAVHQKLMK